MPDRPSSLGQGCLVTDYRSCLSDIVNSDTETLPRARGGVKRFSTTFAPSMSDAFGGHTSTPAVRFVGRDGLLGLAPRTYEVASLVTHPTARSLFCKPLRRTSLIYARCSI